MPFLTRLHGVAGPDRGTWTITQPMLYWDRFTNTWYIILPGVVTDLASIPRLVRWLIPGNGHERQGAVVHDRVYENLGRIEIVLNPGILPIVPHDYNPWADAAPYPFAHHLTPIEARISELLEACELDIGHANLTRKQGDELFARCNDDTGVHPVGKPLLYRAVRIGGVVPWWRTEREWERDPETWRRARDLTSWRCRVMGQRAEIDALDV